MSAPAAKAFWEPVRRIAEMSGDWSKCPRASLSSVMRGVQRALRALGRLRVTGNGIRICDRLIGMGGFYFVPLLVLVLLFE